MAMVHWTVAHRFRRAQQNGFDYDALVSAGWEGLARARAHVGAEADFRTLAFFYIRRAILTYIEWDRRTRRVGLPLWVPLEEAAATASPAHWKPEYARLQLALETLTPQEREAVVEFGMWDRPQAEIGARWGVSESRVGQVYQSGLKKLRTYYGVSQ